MPKLERNASEFHGFQGFESALPTGDLIQKAGDPYFAAALEATWTQRHTENYLQIAQGVVRRIAVVEGIPSYNLPAMSRFFETAQDLVVAPAQVDWSQVAPNAIIGALRTVDDTLKRIGTSVPVLKWFVAIGDALYKLGTLIADTLETREQRGEKMPETALVYDKGTDSDMTDAMLDRVASLDWTDMFLPFAKLEAGSSQTFGPLEWTDRGFPSGFKVTFGSSNVASPGNSRKAVLPGFARICGPTIQARDFGAGYKFASFAAYTEETGDLIPSCCQAGLTLWQFAQKNGPNMWKLDPDKILTAWQNYFHALHLWSTGVWQRGSDQVPDYILAAVFYASHWATRTAPGKTPISLTSTVAWSDVPARFKSWPYTTDQVVAWQLRDLWEPRLRRSLSTLTCAYLSEEYPTIAWAKQSRPELFQRWLDMRELLLRHSARRLVDLELVPRISGDDWRDRLIQARKNAATGLAQPEDGEDRPDLEAGDELLGPGFLPTDDWGEPESEGPALPSWDNEPAFEPVEPGAPSPEKAPTPLYGEKSERGFPWAALAAALGAGVLFGSA